MAGRPTSDDPLIPSGLADPAVADPPRPSVSDIVFRGIVRGLEAQQFVPGQRLVEADLMARFNVGRNAVREAMQRLAAEGLVDLLRHKGAAIRVLSREEVFDLLDIAECIFGLLARKAARGGDQPASAAELEEIRTLLEQADSDQDQGAFLDARRRFYRCLLAMSGSRDLKRLFTSIHIPIVYAQQRVPALQQIRLPAYLSIIRAVLATDADAAEQAATRHVQAVRDALRGQLQTRQH